MKVSELIDQLQQLPANYTILAWDSVAQKYKAPVLHVKDAIEHVLIDAEEELT